MYKNIGKKIKGLATGFFIVEALASVIGSIVILADAYYDTEIVTGVLLLILGPVVAWVSSWLLYGFGELIDKASDIERNTRSGAAKSETQAKVDDERREKLERLRSQGLITEEEYQQALSK